MDRVIRGTGGAGSLEPHGEHTSSGSVASGTVVSVSETGTSMAPSDEDAADTSAIVAMAQPQEGRKVHVPRSRVQGSSFNRDGHSTQGHSHTFFARNMTYKYVAILCAVQEHIENTHTVSTRT